MQGRLIVFEGVEGCGKTTQLLRLQQWLTDHWRQQCQFPGEAPLIQVTREPGGTELGQELRHLLLNRPSQEPMQYRAELLLYAADRAQHVAGFLQPHLAAGALILCDRYTDSTIAYQGYGRGLDFNLIHQLNQIATGGLNSDLTLWLDLDVEVGLARTQRRGTRDRMEQSELAFHRRVQQGYAELARANPQRIVAVDASVSETAVAQQIHSILTQRLKEWYPQLSLPS